MSEAHLNMLLTDVMTRLTEVGREFADSWGRQQGNIAAHESGIGGDRLAAAFLPNYREAGEPLRQSAAVMSAICAACASTGTRSAQDYAGQDQDAARRFSQAGGGRDGDR
ncbi:MULTISPECIES: hypothetical protein [unclassified Crossiella]|uniref:hypothetical protein n=1 Tax=unclassified Crossiella TaxID=2620835 RepID=UPI001FFFFDF5|nr:MULTISPECIES: hypothetical protein [unclassified Crossiella]MCK2242830.1 hypothetical protein [Crossiella sp. S99.2]MCK2256707.1 hypothetical protein [Crossiella sp. S99.1]